MPLPHNLLLITANRWGGFTPVEKRVAMQHAKRMLQRYQELINMMERNPPPELETPYPLQLNEETK